MAERGAGEQIADAAWDFVPIAGAVNRFIKGDVREGAFNVASDVLTVLTLGASKPFTAAAKGGKAAVQVGRAVKVAAAAKSVTTVAGQLSAAYKREGEPSDGTTHHKRNTKSGKGMVSQSGHERKVGAGDRRERDQQEMCGNRNVKRKDPLDYCQEQGCSNAAYKTCPRRRKHDVTCGKWLCHQHMSCCSGPHAGVIRY